MKIRTSFGILLLLFALTSCKQAENNQHEVAQQNNAASVAPAELKLTPKFQTTLRKEMQEIQSAMQQILPLLVQGESEKVAQLAEQIHNSFILKKTLTPDELQALVKLLPAPFMKMDRAFHSESLNLAAAAKAYDFKKSAALYGAMVNSCVNCHMQFAQEQFPELQKQR
ncbi:MAG: hypothetical protein DWQ05_00585 [Calditrichaeota bacterium]|nr:MAG: hypothetical protein DWQ05_00585 [Calditrichota bacterium]